MSQILGIKEIVKGQGGDSQNFLRKFVIFFGNFRP